MLFTDSYNKQQGRTREQYGNKQLPTTLVFNMASQGPSSFSTLISDRIQIKLLRNHILIRPHIEIQHLLCAHIW